MAEPSTLAKHIRDALNDPNRPGLTEIEKRRPGSRRGHILAVAGLLLLCALLLYALPRGWELPF